MPRMSQAAHRKRSTQLLDGLQQHADLMPLVNIAGARRDVPYLEGILRAHVAAIDDAASKRAAYLAAVAVVRTAQESASEVAAMVKSAMLVTHGGKDLVTLSHFGIRPDKKTGPKTLEGKAAGARQGKLTRALRGTMGSRQKRKIKAKRRP
jgi:hypothetical protein